MLTKNIVLLNSCTSALTLALKLTDDDNDRDEVISTPMTCVATNTPIVTGGLKVVWADIDPLTGTIDFIDVASKITSKTRAVMAVAWAGNAPMLRELNSLCESRNVPLILDAAHAFDATYEKRPIHAWADFTCYSLQAIKHVTTGDGGILVCSDDRVISRAKRLKWFGLDRDLTKDEKGNWRGQQWDADIVEAGYKFNMNNITAALGLSQLQYIDNIIGTHRRNAAIYDRLFKTSERIKPLIKPVESVSSSWVYTVLVDAGVDRNVIIKRLNDDGVMAGLVHVPNDTYTAFKSSIADLPGVREFAARQFSLPCGWWLTQDDIEHIFTRVMHHIKSGS